MTKGNNQIDMSFITEQLNYLIRIGEEIPYPPLRETLQKYELLVNWLLADGYKWEDVRFHTLLFASMYHDNTKAQFIYNKFRELGCSHYDALSKVW